MEKQKKTSNAEKKQDFEAKKAVNKEAAKSKQEQKQEAQAPEIKAQEKSEAPKKEAAGRDKGQGTKAEEKVSAGKAGTKAAEEKPEKKKDKVEKTEVKKEKPAKKFIPKAKKAIIKKSKEALENQKKLKGKKKHPVFRGRFGKKNIRRKSKEKWNKWRNPRSMDLKRTNEKGFMPRVGYGNPSEIKGIHPSGYTEVKVHNVKDLEKVNPSKNAARIGAAVGKKKRNAIIEAANEKKIWVLN